MNHGRQSRQSDRRLSGLVAAPEPRGRAELPYSQDKMQLPPEAGAVPPVPPLRCAPHFPQLPAVGRSPPEQPRGSHRPPRGLPRQGEQQQQNGSVASLVQVKFWKGRPQRPRRAARSRASLLVRIGSVYEAGLNPAAADSPRIREATVETAR